MREGWAERTSDGVVTPSLDGRLVWRISSYSPRRSGEAAHIVRNNHALSPASPASAASSTAPGHEGTHPLILPIPVMIPAAGKGPSYISCPAKGDSSKNGENGSSSCSILFTASAPFLNLHRLALQLTSPEPAASQARCAPWPSPSPLLQAPRRATSAASRPRGPSSPARAR